MSGLNGMSLWEGAEDELRAGREHVARQAAELKHYPYTTEGCANAREFLELHRVQVYSGLCGWEIVKMANELITDMELRGVV